MIESIMYFAIGFFVAELTVLAVVPLVHGRAVRLTTRRLEAALPASMAEVRADKDLLRAEFATATRRLEIKVDQLTNNSASQLAELGRKSDAINRLKIERDALRDQLRASEESAAVKVNAARDAERALVEKESELAKLVSTVDERAALADSQNAEIVALTRQVETLNELLGHAAAEARAAEDRRAAAMRDAERALSEKESELAKLMSTAERALAKKESELANLTSTLDERAVLVDSQNAEIAALTRQIQTLKDQLTQATDKASTKESELAKLTHTLDERAALVDSQNTDIATLIGQVQTLQQLLAQAGPEARAAKDRRAAERSELKAATDQLTEERAKFDDFHRRVSELVQRLSAQTAKDKLVARQTREDLQGRIVEQSRLLQDHERELNYLREEIATARQSECDLQITAHNFSAENSRLRAMLERANGERTRLTYELTTLRRQVQNTEAA
jgi:chromosome segregation ATPase